MTAPLLPAAPAQRKPASAIAALRRDLATTLAIALAVALLLTALGGRGFLVKFSYSLAISLCCWAVVAGGQAVVRSWQARRAPPIDPAAATTQFSILQLVSIALVAALVGPTAGIAIGDLVTGYKSISLSRWDSTAVRLTFAFSLAGTVVALVVGTLGDRLVRSRVQAQVAQREAAEYQLKLLQAQLEPHMLFNTLANLRILIGSEPQAAQQMLDRLIAFLRATLAGTRTEAHPLAQEFARLDDYLALMRVRMGQRLQVALDLPAALREVAVPPLLLQPLVENCIRHGLEPKVGPGRIAVHAAQDGSSLRLVVRDTGVGLSDHYAAGGSHFGVEQVRRRLHTLYGAAASLTLAPPNDAEGGTVATVILPLQQPIAATA
jgi:hypothetical protein